MILGLKNDKLKACFIHFPSRYKLRFFKEKTPIKTAYKISGLRFYIVATQL